MEKTEFEHNVSSLRHRLLKIGTDYLGNDADAEDLVQEVLIKLWMLRQRIADKRHLQGLAMVVARNSAISVLRSKKQAAVVSIDDRAVSDIGQADAQRDMEAREDDEMMRRCIASLPDKQRAILRMRNVEQLSYTDIANILGTTEASVRGLISRARRQLLAKMKGKLQ